MKFTVMASIIFIIGFIAFAYMHEHAHVEIFRSYGVTSHVEYFSHFPDAVTIADGNRSRCTANCDLAHDINEVVGYQLMPFYFAFGLLGVLAICILENKEIL